MKQFSLFFFLTFSLSGCALGLVKSLHQVSYLEQAEIPEGNETKPIFIEVSQNVILGLQFNANYAENGWKQFLNLCSNGEILNPIARHSTDLGFFAYKNRIRFEGTCVTR